MRSVADVRSSIMRGRRRDDSAFKFRTDRKLFVGDRPDVMAFLVLVLCAGCHGYQEQRFVVEPQDQSALIGSSVKLPCQVENKAGTVQWTKDDFGLGTHRNLSGYERYQMVGSDSEGEYFLEIKNISIEDDARYQCQVSSGFNGEPAIRSQYAQLTVLVAPEAPRILQGVFIDAVEGQKVYIECVSSGGKPASNITWLIDGEVVKKNITQKIETDENDETFTTRSSLKLYPTKLNHNSAITCQAQNDADRAQRVAALHIEVKYAPKITMTVKSNTINGKVPEGSEARFRCDADSNPGPQIYRWYINDNAVIGDYTDEMIIFNVSRKHNNAKIRCEVINSIGQGESSVNLEVTYPPKFRTMPEDIEASSGSTVTVHCDVDGDPEPEIRWLFNQPGRIGFKGNEPQLEVVVDETTSGKYICKATVEGYPEIEAAANILLKGIPIILSNATQMGTEGESVRVECTAASVPKPVDIRWYFEGREISAIHDPNYATLEEVLPDGIVRSTLVIRSSRAQHFGMYNCSITNEIGNANALIVLKATKTFPLLLILAGTATGTIVFSIFIALLVYCLRKTRCSNDKFSEKPDVTETTGDYKDSDRSSNISDLKLHLHSEAYDLDYSSSDASQTKVPVGLPLAGPVPLRLKKDPMMQFRYSNDYSDPAFSDPYLKNSAYIYDYQPGFLPPPTLRVQTPNPADLAAVNRSLQGSLTRSIDTTSTVALSNSQSSSLKRNNEKSIDEVDAINSLGLPPVNGGNAPIYAQPNSKNSNSGSVDLRYAATYGNPYLRNNSSGLPVIGPKPLSNPAPPPYSSLRSSANTTSGNKPQQGNSTHV